MALPGLRGKWFFLIRVYVRSWAWLGYIMGNVGPLHHPLKFVVINKLSCYIIIGTILECVSLFLPKEGENEKLFCLPYEFILWTADYTYSRCYCLSCFIDRISICPQANDI